MSNSQWVIFFGEDWRGLNSTGQYLAREFARTHRVLWVNSLGLRAPQINLADIRRIARKLVQFVRTLVVRHRSDADTPSVIEVVAPLAIPYLRYRLVRRINRILLRMQLRPALQARSIVDPIVITACPSTVDVLDEIPAALRVYYCADEHSALQGMDGPLVAGLEAEMLKKIDLVIVTAKALEEAKGMLHPRVRYLPHGVDYHLFSRSVHLDLPLPSDIATLKRPIVGFIGSIGKHIDHGIIRKLAKGLSDVSVVLVGPLLQDTEQLMDYANVHYLGMRAHDRLPDYLAGFDVCIIPWSMDRRNRFANPTKQREYLAAGCPVVSTPHRELVSVDRDVYVGNTPEEFLVKTKRLLSGEGRRSRREISRSMEEHDWSMRAREMWSLIESELKLKESRAASTAEPARRVRSTG